MAQIGLLLLDDMQKAFGINTARHKQSLVRCERGFDRLFFFVHQALRLSAIPNQTLGGLWRELQREAEQLLPRRVRQLRMHRAGTLGKVVHWWEMLEQPRAWLAETAHDALQQEVHASLAAALPSTVLARHLTVAELQTYLRLKLGEVVRPDQAKLASFDYSTALEQLGGDEEMLHNMLSSFMQASE